MDGHKYMFEDSCPVTAKKQTLWRLDLAQAVRSHTIIHQLSSLDVHNMIYREPLSWRQSCMGAQSLAYLYVGAAPTHILLAARPLLYS